MTNVVVKRWPGFRIYTKNNQRAIAEKKTTEQTINPNKFDIQQCMILFMYIFSHFARTANRSRSKSIVKQRRGAS